MKIYMTRAQTKALLTMDGCYVGDPTGGAAYGERNDPVTAMVGGSLVSGLMGANAAQGAANTQAAAGRDASAAQLQATRETNAMQQAMFDKTQANQQPYLQAGGQGLKSLQEGLQAGGAFTQTFKPSDLTTDPSYQWRLNQGTQALNASAAARGLMGSGQNLKDITDYAQGSASQEYQNAFNRFNTNQSNLYNRISSLAGMGQNTAVGMAQQGNQAAQSMGQNTMAGVANSNNYLTGAAAANAAGQVGMANAFGGALSSAGQNWMGGQMLNSQQNYLSNMAGNNSGNIAGGGSFAPMVVPQAPGPVSLGLTAL
jgi:hypothetical protein